MNPTKTNGEGYAQTVSGTLQRPRYSPGLILEDSDLTAAVDYTRDLNRLMFRSLFGCGVVCGLTASVGEKCGLTIKVQPGLAIDPCGDPIHVKAGVEIVIPEGKIHAADYWIVVRNKERTCEQRSVMCDDDDDLPSQPTRIRACAEVSLLTKLPDCACAHYGLHTKLGTQTADDLANLARVLVGNGPLDPETAVNDCPSCDCGCGCDDYVVIGWVHKYGEDWGVLHRGVRRFVRPALEKDPYLNIAPKTVPVTDGGDGPRQQTGVKG